VARRSGVFAGGVAALLMVAGVGAGTAGGAGTAAEAMIFAGNGADNFAPNPVHIKPGDSVRFVFDNPTMPHNVKSTSPNWSVDTDQVPDHPDLVQTFIAEGEYTFLCEVHAGTMYGTIIVSNMSPTVTPTQSPTQSPTASPTASPTVSATASPTATPVTPAATAVPTAVVPTPAPSSTPSDTKRPTVSSVKLTAVTHGVKARFKLSERSTVKVTVKRGSKTLKSVTSTQAAGTRTVTAKGSKVTRGKVTVEIRATDAAGNTSAQTKRSVSIRR